MPTARTRRPRPRLGQDGGQDFDERDIKLCVDLLRRSDNGAVAILRREVENAIALSWTTHVHIHLMGYCLLLAVQSGREILENLQMMLTERGHSFTATAEKVLERDIKEKLHYVALDVDYEMAMALSALQLNCARIVRCRTDRSSPSDRSGAMARAAASSVSIKATVSRRCCSMWRE